MQLSSPQRGEKAILHFTPRRVAARSTFRDAFAHAYPSDRIRLACDIGRAMAGIIGDSTASYLTGLSMGMLAMLRGVGATRSRPADVADVLAASHASWCFLYGNGYDIKSLARRPPQQLLRFEGRLRASTWDDKVKQAQDRALNVLSGLGSCIHGKAFTMKVRQVHATLLMLVFSTNQRLPW